ncbi:Werner Syndrome-like exonuclease, partial [Prunus dulcis]|uniref:Werner Syndrome-like exonuclease n=1 Tax=Prunus dulcis TaxID=3755 RepID=UPI001482D519
MSITITDYELDCNTHDLYRVDFFNDYIKILVTHTPSKLRSWIQKIKYLHRYRLHKLIVGLDVEWRPSFTKGITNPVATLQLCVGHSCLIFQLRYAPRLPKCLFDSLGDPRFTFVGVGIGEDVRKLMDDYGLVEANFVDLRVLEARGYGWSVPQNLSLKDMAEEVLGQEFQKPKTITTSHWDKPCLSLAQVKYACVDAFVSFEIARVLRQQIQC